MLVQTNADLQYCGHRYQNLTSYIACYKFKKKYS